jgi:hypothetical protein
MTCVERLYEKVLADPRTRPFFEGLSMSVQTQKQISFLSWAFGGPPEYRGRDLGERTPSLWRGGSATSNSTPSRRSSTRRFESSTSRRISLRKSAPSSRACATACWGGPYHLAARHFAPVRSRGAGRPHLLGERVPGDTAEPKSPAHPEPRSYVPPGPEPGERERSPRRPSRRVDAQGAVVGPAA